MLKNLERYGTQLQVAAEIARDAATARNLDSLLNRAVELVIERFGFYYAGVFLLDDVNAYAVLTAASGKSGAKLLAQAHKIKVGDMGIVGHVAKLGQPWIVLDVDKDPIHLKQPILPDTRSEMAVPLKVINRVIGVFDVQSKQASDFDGNDLIAMQTMADQLAIAIENMRLVIEAQRRSQELSGLYDAALATSSVLDTNMLLERLYEQVNHLMAPDTLMVTLYDSRDETFSVAFAIEEESPVVEFIDQRYSLSQGGLTGWVLENRQPLLVGDIDIDPLPIEPIRGLQPVHAWLGVPLVSRSNLIGAVSVQSFQPHVFDDSHQRFLESLAAQSATALENARLFEAEQAAREHAETLQGIAEVIGSSLEPGKILELILGQLNRVLTFDTASVLLWEESGSPAFVAVIGYEDLGLVKSESGVTLTESRILSKMAHELQPILIADVRNAPDWIWVPGAEHVRSFLAAPVIVRDEMIGVLMADSKKLNFFTEVELKTVQALARHMAVAIENARLFEAERVARENAEALRDAAQVIGSTLSVDEIIDAVLERLFRVLPYDLACVYLIEDNIARVQAGRGYEKFTDFKGFTSTTLTLDSTSVQEIVGNGNSLLISDVREYPGWVHTVFSEHVRSYLGVPLRARDQVVGFFSLDRVTPGSFNKSDLEIGQIFAAQTAVAIENARLFKAEEKRAAELEILRQVSLGLTASLEPKSVLDAILDGVFKLIPDVQDAHIFTYDGERLTFGSALWHDGQRGELFSEPRQDGLTYKTARSGETIVINDFKTHPMFTTKAVEENWVGSIVGIPFKIGERVVGVLNVAHQDTYAFSRVDLRILRLLGDQAALAIDNARLFEQTMMERRHISLLYDVGQALAISLDPDVIMEKALTLTCKALEGNVGAVWSFNHDEGALFLQLLYVDGVLPTNNLNPDDLRMDLGDTIVGWSAQQKKAVNIPDVTQDDRWTEITYIDEDVHSMVTAPFSDGQNLLGVMTILHNQVFAFTDDHLDLLESICRQMGLALSNARRYQDINRLVDLLAAEQYRLESLIEMLPVGVLLLDENHRLLLTNPLGRELLTVLSPQTEDNTIRYLGDILLADILESQDSFLPFEISVMLPKRCIFEAQARKVGGETIQWVLTLRDVTHEREIQERVQMQDRLATVGQLAAGIAHDFNNIMAAIVVYTDLLMLETSLSEVSQERLTIIQQQVQRASSLIRQILDFSRRSVMEQSSLNMLPLLKEMQRLLERTLPETIQLDLQYEEGDYTILADPTRLQQVLMNLAVNARDAMADGGLLTFTLNHHRTTVGVAPPVMEMPLGDWICVSVSDTGVGIHPDNLSRIFEPFFTTKPVGQGTGLGLAQVYGIVRQHEGYIDVTSSEGKGTRFDIYLPSLMVQQDATEYEIEGGTVDGIGKTVLLVEDDPSTRTAVQHLLVAQNFQVLLASNGAAALEILEERYSEITLVVSDIVMPEMGGMELFTVMQIRWPDIQILFITGHPLEEQEQGVLERGNVDWLQKPFSLSDFSQVIQRLMDQIG